MNLLDEPWIPVRRASGERLWIAPYQITDRIKEDPIVALDAARPDFNGALIQFLIGLVQTAWAQAGKDFGRDTMLWEPPTPEFLKERFFHLKEAFELDGDGARFMQDRTLSVADKHTGNDIAALLVESPGENTLKDNKDHFIKRGGIEALCPCCVALALFTLQTNAPGGGAGNRTSLRGGGPLTTLLIYTRTNDNLLPALWRDVASNVLPKRLIDGLCDPAKSSAEFRFPWMVPINSLQKENGETQPLDVHPCHIFWAMPRRIRLDFDEVSEGYCDICGGQSSRLLHRYIAKNYGMNYKGPWRHPLSPYYGKSRDDLLPLHPQPGGIGYQHWLGLVLGVQQEGKFIESAAVVRHFLNEEVNVDRFRLWAFGYDMDNMKARCWYEGAFPLFDLPSNSDTESLQQIVQWLVSGAEKAAICLRMSVKDVWIGDGELRGDIGFIDTSFWSRTERPFFEHVQEAVRLAKSEGTAALDASVDLRRSWLRTLQAAVPNLFDELAATGDVEASHPERMGVAYQNLRKQLYGDKIHEALGLIKPKSSAKTNRSRRKRGTVDAQGELSS